MAGLTSGRGKEVKRHVKVIKGPRVRRQLGESPERKPELPVTCGNKKGILHKDRYNKSQPCIFSNGKWFRPSEFEKFGGKEKNKKWKISIFYKQIGLQTLIQQGILSSPSFKARRSLNPKQCRKKLFKSRRRSTRHSKESRMSESVVASDWSSEIDSSDDYDGEEDGVDDEDDDHGGGDDQDVYASGDSFNVTCCRGKGILHVNRFATEICGKCIRTPDAWLTPRDFLKKNKPDGNWRRDIVSCGVPLGDLIIKTVLRPHKVNCKCPICTQEPLHLLDQNNDDTCFMCSKCGDLVCCAKCPRAFHHHCHKPALSDDTIGEHWTCYFCKKSALLRK